MKFHKLILTLAITCMPFQSGVAANPLHLSMDDATSITQAGAKTEDYAFHPAGVKGKAMGFDGIRTVVKVAADQIRSQSLCHRSASGCHGG